MLSALHSAMVRGPTLALWFDIIVISMALAAAIGLYVYSSRQQGAPREPPFPPGPPRLPVLGNLLQMPSQKGWLTFARFAKNYGDIVYLRVLGRHLVLLNTYEVANELLDKRSLIYSDRPHFPIGDLVEMPQFNFGFMPLGAEWALRRKTFANQYGRTVPNTFGAHRDAVNTLLRNLHCAPDRWPEHLRLHPVQATVSVTYGLKVDSIDDQLVRTAEEAMATVSVIIRPDMWIINPVHFLQAWPHILGGGYIRRRIERWRNEFRALRNIPWTQSKSAGAECFVTRIAQGLEDLPEQRRETIVRDCAAIAYGGAAETTFSYETIFILTMLLHPDVQSKAHEELDRVVGDCRLPDFNDRENLPYLAALLKEVLRWHAVAPQGIPHLLKESDVYRGYRLPKGTIVIANAWTILRDPCVYPEPEQFQPERFLKDGKLFVTTNNDPSRVAFGFGRRVCPGRAFAEDALWLLFARVLAVFRLESPAGVQLNPNALMSFSSGATSHALPFPCAFVPRTDRSLALVKE